MPKSFKDFIEDPESQEKDENGKVKAPPTHTLEGDLIVMPDCIYRSGDQYTLRGLGGIFNGDYRVRRVTHTIDQSGYNVQMTMTKGTIDGNGSGSTAAKAAAKPTAADTRRTPAEKPKPKTENKTVTVNKATGGTTTN